jgi:biotin synthase
MSDEIQALCFFAGANSIFYGDKLLTTGNPQNEKDRALMARLGLRPEERQTAEVAVGGGCEHHAHHDCDHGHDHAAAH